MVRKVFIIFLILSACLSIVQPQTCDYFIKQGLQNSPLLKDYQNQLNSSDIDNLLIKASHKPLVNGNVQLMYAPYSNNFGYDEAITNGGNYSTVVGVSQFIFNKKIYKNKFEAISIQKQSIINTSRISSNELKRLITDQYITAFSDFNDLTFNKSFLKLMYEQTDIVKQLVNNGIYKQSDFLSLLIENQTQEILVKQLQIQYFKDARLLKQICGINDTNHYELIFPEIKKMNTVSYSYLPLFMQFHIDSLKILNERQAINMNYRPKISWLADAGMMTSNPSNAYNNFGFSVGINFSVPIYDGKQKKLNYQKQDILENTRTNYELFFKNQYNQQLQQLDEELVNTKEMEEQLKKQLKTSEELINIYKILLNTGNVSITDLINSIKNHININRNLNQLQIKELQTITEWNYLMQQ